MSTLGHDCKKPFSVLLAIVLLAAQMGALAHAYEHEPGSLQAQVCSTCIAGHYLSSVCLGSTAIFDFQKYNADVNVERAFVSHANHLTLARQRAPPTPL